MSQANMNPFPGLRPFGEEEDYLFFGREEQTNDLLELLREQRFLAVVGTSGSGKSSLVRAGMLPALYGGTMASVGSDWETVVFRPGGDPLLNLADAMINADLYDPEDPESRLQIRATLSRSRQGLVQAVEYSDMPAGSNLLIVVDQFEELFRFRGTSDKHQELATAFVKLLLNAAKSQEQSIYVVITMRSDFLGDCAHLPGLAEAVNDGKYLIPKLTRDQRRDAIVMPAAVGGGKISESLVQQLLNDVGDDADQLPILQHALMRIWDYWQDDHADDEPVSLRHYDAAGGMDNALSNHADEVYDSLPSEESRALARLVFQAITERGGDERGIRRPTRMDSLCRIVNGTPQDVEVILDAYRKVGRTFVMPLEGTEITDETVVDISHESLMRVWRRLTHWVEEESQNARVYTRLAETAELHAKELAGVYRDPDLAIALSWKETAEPTKAWGHRYRDGFQQAIEFLEKSYETTRAEEIAQEEARERELEQAKLVATLQARAKKRLTVLLCGIAAALVVAVFMYFDSLEARDDAESSRNEAVAAAIESKRLAIAAENSEEAAVASEQAAKESEAEAQRQAELAKENATRADEQAQAAEEARRLADQQARDAELARKNARQSLYFSQLYRVQNEQDDSERFRAKERFITDWGPQSGLEDLRGWEWYHLASRPKKFRYTVHTAFFAFQAQAYCRNSNEFFSVRGADVIEKISLETGEVLSSIFVDAAIDAIAILPDDQRLVVNGYDGVLRIVYADTGIVEREYYLLDGLTKLAVTTLFVSDDGSKIYAGASEHGFIVDLSEDKIQEIPQNVDIVAIGDESTVDFRYIAVSSDLNTILVPHANGHIWQYDSSNMQWKERTEVESYTVFDFSPDAKQLAVGFREGVIKLLDSVSFEVLQVIQTNSEDPITNIVWDPNGSRLIASDSESNNYGITFGETPIVKSVLEREWYVQAYEFIPNNVGLSVHSTTHGRFHMDDPFEERLAPKLENAEISDYVFPQAAFTSDNKYVIIDGETTVDVYDRETGKKIHTLLDAVVSYMHLSNDESMIAVGGGGAEVCVFEVGSWKQLFKIPLYNSQAFAWSPDDRKIVFSVLARDGSSGSSEIRIVDISDQSNLEVGDAFYVPGEVYASAWDSTGKKLALTGFVSRTATERVFYVDADTQQVTKTAAGLVVQALAINFIGDSQRVAVTGDVTARVDKGFIDIIDFAPAVPTVKSTTHDLNLLIGANVSRDGKRLLVRSTAGVVKLFDIDTLEEVQALTSPDDQITHVQFNNITDVISALSIDGRVSQWDASDGYEQFGDGLDQQLRVNPSLSSTWTDKQLGAAASNYIEFQGWDAATAFCNSFFENDDHRARNPIQTNWWISPLTEAKLDESTPLENSPDVFANGVPAGFAEKWQRIATDDEGLVYANKLFGEQREKSIYTLCRVFAPTTANYGVFLAAADQHRLWVNGEEIHSSRTFRPLRDDSDFVSVQLNQGWNTFLMKVYQRDQNFGWQLRVSSKLDEMIIGGLKSGDLLGVHDLISTRLLEQPDNSKLRYMRTLASRYLPESDSILSDLDILRKDSPSSELSRLKATFHSRAGDYDQAVETLATVDTSKRFDVESLFRLAAIHRKQGNFEKADEIYMRAVERSGFTDATVIRARREMESIQLVTNGKTGGSHWRFSTTAPLDPSWSQAGFDDNHWNFLTNGVYKDLGGVGSNSRDLWYRCDFYLDEIPDGPIQMAWEDGIQVSTVYLNGVPIYQHTPEMTLNFNPTAGPLAKQALRIGRNVLAVRSHFYGTTPNERGPEVRLSILDRPRTFGAAFKPKVDAMESTQDRWKWLNWLANYTAGYHDLDGTIELIEQALTEDERGFKYHLHLGTLQFIGNDIEGASATDLAIINHILTNPDTLESDNRLSTLCNQLIYLDLSEQFNSRVLDWIKILAAKEEDNTYAKTELALREKRFDDVAALVGPNSEKSDLSYSSELYMMSKVHSNEYSETVDRLRLLYRHRRMIFQSFRQGPFREFALSGFHHIRLATVLSRINEIIALTDEQWQSLDADGFGTRAYAQILAITFSDMFGSHEKAKDTATSLATEYIEQRGEHGVTVDMQRLDAAMLWVFAGLAAESRPDHDLVANLVSTAVANRDTSVSTWELADIVSAESAAGGTLFASGNGVVQTTGVAPDHDIYRIRFGPKQPNVTAIEITYLADPEQTFGGPGIAQSNAVHTTGMQIFNSSEPSEETIAEVKHSSVSYAAPTLSMDNLVIGDGKEWLSTGQQGQDVKLVANLGETQVVNSDGTMYLELAFIDSQFLKRIPGKVQIRTTDADGTITVPEYLIYDAAAPMDTATLAALVMYNAGEFEQAEQYVRISESENNLSLYGWILLANIEKRNENLAEAARWYSKIEDTSDRWARGEPIINALFDEYHAK